MSLEDKKQNLYCPICKVSLSKKGAPYTIDELFKLWVPIQFDKETIEEHRCQSEYTQMYSCPECDLEVFLPQIIGTPDFYIELQKASDPYYVSDKWDFEEALKDAKNAESIIEIGCGPGTFLEKAKPYVNQVFGVEYNDQALKIARSKGLKVFGVDDEDAVKMKGQLDAAFSFHVLEHVPDPVGFIREMFTWVKPGGFIGLSVPNMEGPVKYINPCISDMPPHHATRWKMQTFEVLAKRHGFKIERVAYEPLCASNYYYYSSYWVNHYFPAKSLPNSFLRLILPRLFDLTFKTLSIINKKTLNLLRGQSIYICMSKVNK